MNATKRMVLLSGGAIALGLVAFRAGAGNPRKELLTRRATMTCRRDGGSPIVNPGIISLATVPDSSFTLDLSNCVAGQVHFFLADGGFGSPFTRSTYLYDGGVRPLALTQLNPTAPGLYSIQFKGQVVIQARGSKSHGCPNCVDEAPGGIRVSTSGETSP